MSVSLRDNEMEKLRSVWMAVVGSWAAKGRLAVQDWCCVMYRHVQAAPASLLTLQPVAVHMRSQAAGGNRDLM